jgi:hypothetical protein
MKEEVLKVRGVVANRNCRDGVIGEGGVGVVFR